MPNIIIDTHQTRRLLLVNCQLTKLHIQMSICVETKGAQRNIRSHIILLNTQQFITILYTYIIDN